MKERLLRWRRRVSRTLGGYDAFLSYRHGVDRARVVAVQRALHKIGKPWWKFRAASVFRDEDGLPLTEAFWPLVESALRASRHLVLFASPAAKDSKWIPREVAVWRSLEPRRPVCIVLTGGTVAWDETARDFDWAVSDALPEVLRGLTDQEPLWADLRGLEEADLDLKKEPFRTQAVKIAAAVHGLTPEQMASDDARQHRRTMTLAWSVAALLGSALVAVIALLLSVSAEKWRAEQSAVQASFAGFREQQQAGIARANEKTANEQRSRAEKEQRRAEREALQALARQLAAQAVAEQNEQLVVAANLSLVATRLANTVESRASLLSIAQRHPQLERLVHTDLPVGWRDLHLTGDGRYLAVTLPGHAPELWDMHNGRRASFPVSVSKTTKIALAPDRAVCAISREGGVIELWDLGERRLLHRLPTGMAEFRFIAVGAGARQVAAGDLTATLFDSMSGAAVAEGVTISTEGIHGIRIVPGPRLVLDFGSYVQLVDFATKEPTHFPDIGTPTLASAVSPDGQFVALGAQTGKIEVWDLAANTRAAEIEGDGLQPSAIRFSEDGERLVSLSGGAGNDATIRARSWISVWNWRRGVRLGRRIEGPPAPLWSFAASGDLQRIAAITRHAPIWVWNTRAPHLLAQSLADDQNDVWRSQMSGDGKTLLLERMDSGRVEVADPLTGRVVRTLLPADRQRRIRTLDLSPDGAYAIVSEEKAEFQPPATITLWSTRSEQPLLRLDDAVDSSAIAISSDGRRMAWARSSTELVVYDREHRRDLFVAKLPFRHPLILRFVEGDRALLLIDSSGFARLDLATRGMAVTRTAAVMSNHAVSGDGRIIAATLDSRQILTWDSRTGRSAGPPLVADTDVLVLELALSADGSTVAAGTSSGSILLWDRVTSRRLGAPLVGHARGVTELHMTGDAMRLVTREHRGAWNSWRIDPRNLHRRACTVANRNLTREEWAFYVPGHEYEPNCTAADFAL